MSETDTSWTWTVRDRTIDPDQVEPPLREGEAVSAPIARVAAGEEIRRMIEDVRDGMGMCRHVPDPWRGEGYRQEYADGTVLWVEVTPAE